MFGLATRGQGILWEKKIGWKNDDVLTDVLASPDGSFIACGTGYHFGTFGIATDYHDAICLVSVSALGDSLWTVPTGLYGRSPRLCPGDSQSFFLVSTSTFTPPASVESTLVISKVGLNGRLLWSRPIPNVSGEAKSAIQARNGSILVTGLGGAIPGSGGINAMFVIRLDTSGVVYFNERYSDNPRTSGNRIEETPVGTYLASGTSGSRIWAIELDSKGREIRRQVFYETPTRAVLDESACVRQAPGGRYIATGSPLSFSPGFYYFGSYSAFSSSSNLWGGERYGSSSPPHIQDDGSVVLYANRNGIEYLTKFGMDSSRVWDWPVRSAAYSSVPVITAFSYLADSSVIAVGKLYLSTPAFNDFYITRIRGIGVPYNPAQPVANRPRHKGLPALIAYPTPATGQLTVHTRSIQPLTVFALTGKIMLEAQPDPSGTTQLDVSSLPAGLYLLRQGESVVRVVRE